MCICYLSPWHNPCQHLHTLRKLHLRWAQLVCAKGCVLLYSQTGNKCEILTLSLWNTEPQREELKRSPTKGTLAEEGRKWALLLEMRCFVTVKQNLRGSSLMMFSDSYRHRRKVWNTWGSSWVSEEVECESEYRRWCSYDVLRHRLSISCMRSRKRDCWVPLWVTNKKLVPQRPMQEIVLQPVDTHGSFGSWWDVWRAITHGCIQAAKIFKFW